jgi:hypothetical protein
LPRRIIVVPIIYFDNNKTEIIVYIDNLKKIIASTNVLKNSFKQNYNFLSYYYNDSDGKLFRYNFITHTLSEKLDNKIISPDMYKLFLDIRNNFNEIRECLLSNGLAGFGPSDFNYRMLLEFLFKVCKIIEFYYLRSSKYDNLKEFRTDYAHDIEKEYDLFIDL